MWFGTLDGLNRFDGYEFRIFRQTPGDENSIGGNFINTMFEGRNGMLWFGMRGGGLSSYDPKTEQFTSYRHDPKDPHSLSSDVVHAILEDQDGFLWVGTVDGLNRFEPQLNGFTHYKHDPNEPTSISHNEISNIVEDPDGILWIGTEGGGLNRFDRKREIFTVYSHNPDDANTLGHNTITGIHRDTDGVFWIATWGGGLDRLEFDGEAPHFTHYKNDPENPSSLSHDSIYTLYADEAGGLWIGTLGGGLNHFDYRTEQFTTFQNNPDDPYSLNHDSVLSIAGGRTGLLWLGTGGGGVNVLDLKPKAFNHVYGIPGDPKTLNSNDVMGIYQEPDNAVWIGTGSGGLNKFDTQTHQVSHYQPDPNDPDSISQNTVREITQDSQGMLWLATWNGLNRFDPETEEATVYFHNPEDPDGLLHNSIYTVRLIEDGSILVGSSAGVNRVDPSTGEISIFHQTEEIEEILSNTEPVLSIEEDEQGVLWIGTGGSGLIQFDPQEERITQYQHNLSDPDSLADDTIWNVFIDQAGRLWIGTSVGLDRFDSATSSFVHFNENDGFPPGGVASILEDDLPVEAGGPNLWISSSAGLTRFNPETGAIRNYDVTDGLQSNAFSWSAAIKSESGELFFGGTNGLTSFFPSQISDNSDVPPVIITNLELANQPVKIGEDGILSQAIAFTDQLFLPHDARVISFEFAALNYRAPEKNRYRYMLEGFDEDWTEVGADRRLVTYTNLDPGDYTFRVLGSNNDGVWNEEGTSIAITIASPWWQTTWFRLAVGASLIGLVGLAFVEQGRRRRMREQELEALVETRTQELAFSQAQIGALFENSPLAIGTASIDGYILSANATMAKMLGYTVDELIGTNLSDVFPDSEQRKEVVQRLIAEKIVQSHGQQLKRKDGTLFYTNITESILERENQKVILSIVDDITDQILAEQALKEKEEAAAVAAERSRIARELHDSVTQSLYSASLIAEAVPKYWQQQPEEAADDLGKLRLLTRGAQAEMRTLLLELRPGELADHNLSELLSQLTDALSARTELPVSLTVAGDCQLSPRVQIAYYRITQEALNNIIKHARANRAWVNLKCEKDRVTLRVGDDGRGFDPDSHQFHQLGLKIMRERAEAIGATLTIKSQPGQGTTVSVVWQAAE